MRNGFLLLRTLAVCLLTFFGSTLANTLEMNSVKANQKKASSHAVCGYVATLGKLVDLNTFLKRMCA